MFVSSHIPAIRQRGFSIHTALAFKTHFLTRSDTVAAESMSKIYFIHHFLTEGWSFLLWMLEFCPYSELELQLNRKECRSIQKSSIPKPSGICSSGQELSETRKRSRWSGIMNPSFWSLSLLSDMIKDCLGSMTTVLSFSCPAASTSAYDGLPEPRRNFMMGHRVGRRCGGQVAGWRCCRKTKWKPS